VHDEVAPNQIGSLIYTKETGFSGCRESSEGGQDDGIASRPTRKFELFAIRHTTDNAAGSIALQTGADKHDAISGIFVLRR
jgi:hypothetical protein